MVLSLIGSRRTPLTWVFATKQNVLKRECTKHINWWNAHSEDTDRLSRVDAYDLALHCSIRSIQMRSDETI